jgi:hypothetical protein
MRINITELTKYQGKFISPQLNSESSTLRVHVVNFDMMSIFSSYERSLVRIPARV